MEYNQYLLTDHWQKTRNKRLKEHGWCWICKSTKNLQVHHKRYKGRDGESLLFREMPSTIIPLCASCHRLLHYHFGINVTNRLFISVKTELEKMQGSGQPSKRKLSAIPHAHLKTYTGKTV